MRRYRTVIEGAIFALLGIVALLLVAMIVNGAVRAIFAEPGPSSRQEAVRDAVEPCAGGRVSAIDLDEDGVDFDVRVRCAP